MSRVRTPSSAPEIFSPTINDEGIVITFNGVYVKVGYSQPDFLPYEEARNHGRIITSDGIIPILFPCPVVLTVSKKYTSGKYKNFPEFLKRISSYITDFEKRETQERELLKSFNEVFDAQLEPQKPEPPKNFFAKLFFRFRNKDLPTYPGLGFGNAEIERFS